MAEASYSYGIQCLVALSLCVLFETINLFLLLKFAFLSLII
jgi:hypothetical protein